eukprot:12283-Heterococcus_DN1.PRE.2
MAALEGGGADSSSYNNSYSSQSEPPSAGSARRLSASSMVRAVFSSGGSRRASGSNGGAGTLHLAHDHDHSPGGTAAAQYAVPSTDSYTPVVHADDDNSSSQQHYTSTTVTAATAAAAALPPLPPAPHRVTSPPIDLPNVNDYSRVGLPDTVHDITATDINSSNSEYKISSRGPGIVGSTLADLSSKDLSRSLHGPKRNQQQQQQQQQATGPYSTATSTATASSGSSSSMKPPPVTAKSSTAAAAATSAQLPLRTDRAWWQQWRAPNYRGVWIWWCGVLLYITCLLTLAQTALTEPGYLPPKPRSTAIETMPAAVREKRYNGRIGTSEHHERVAYVTHKDTPPRSRHCRHCNNCVAVMDHHCPHCQTVQFALVTAIASIMIPISTGDLGQTTSEYLKGERRRHKDTLSAQCFSIWLKHIPPSLLPQMHEYPTQDDIERNAKYASATLATLSQSTIDSTHR